MRLAALLCLIPQVHALGLLAAQGLLLSETFYWDLNDGTRNFSERYAPQVNGAKPCTIQVGCYSGVFHYLKAVATLGVDTAESNGAAALAKMKEIPTEDIVFGRMVAKSMILIFSKSRRRSSRNSRGTTIGSSRRRPANKLSGR
jgi:branched-chain amino acid transport system substrate-binding protein